MENKKKFLTTLAVAFGLSTLISGTLSYIIYHDTNKKLTNELYQNVKKSRHKQRWIHR